MATNQNEYNQPHSNDQISAAQGRWWELLSPTQVLTGEEELQQQETVKKKRKCNGNRKLQHFKRKCRARGLNEEKITTLIHERNDTTSERSLGDQTIHELSHGSRKRKRYLSTQHLILSPI